MSRIITGLKEAVRHARAEHVIDAIIESGEGMPVQYTQVQRRKEFKRRMKARGYDVLSALNDANAPCIDIEPMGR